MLDLQYKDKPNKQSEMTQYTLEKIEKINSLRKEIAIKRNQIKSAKSNQEYDKLQKEMMSLMVKMKVQASCLATCMESALEVWSETGTI